MKQRILVLFAGFISLALTLALVLPQAIAGPGYYGGGDYTANYAYGWVGQGLGGYPGPFPGKIPKDPDRDWTFSKSQRRFSRQTVKTSNPTEIIQISKVPIKSDGATFIVVLPEQADFWIDGKKSDRTGNKRVVHSPTLKPGRVYSYTFKASWKEMDIPKEEIREVFFLIGEEVNVQFGNQK